MQCELEGGKVEEDGPVVLYLLGQMEVQLKAVAEGYGSQGNPVTLDSENEDNVKIGVIRLPSNERENGDQEDCQYLGCTEMENQEFETCVLSQGSEEPKPMFLHDKPPLSPEQLEIIRLVHEGKNVFFSGPGGTGKSFVLHKIITEMERKYLRHHCEGPPPICGLCFPCNVAVTAPTGIAALEIGGTTIHSASRIGIPLIPEHFGRMWSVRERWRNLKVLIIDEISMISAEMLEYLEQTVRAIRARKNKHGDKEDLPFGGIQVIFSGDFFQLLPVVDEGSGSNQKEFLNRGLAFESRAWRRAGLHTVLLQQVFRQEDKEFVKMLNDIRTGQNPQALRDIQTRCSRPLPVIFGILPTRLYPKNSSVDRHNRSELAKLREVEVILAAKDLITTCEQSIHVMNDHMSSLFDEKRHRQQYDRLKKHSYWEKCRAAKEIHLKIGAQVMLLWNIKLKGPKSEMLVNGSRGVIVGWKSTEQILDEKHVAGRERRCEWDSSVFDLLRRSGVECVPVVQFRNGSVVDCVPEAFTHEVLNVGVCTRLQVPLKLAWALTIHKSQGMSLDWASVHLQDVRDEGQAYVALSRVRSIEGLQVVPSNQVGVIKVNARVKIFYNALEKQQEPPAIELNFDTLEFQFPASQEGMQFPEGIPAWKFPQIPPGRQEMHFPKGTSTWQFPPSQDDSIPGPATPLIFRKDVELQQHQQHSVPSDTCNLKPVSKPSPSIIQYEVHDPNVLLSPATCNLKAVEPPSPSIPFEVYDPEFLLSSATCYHCRSSDHLAHVCFKRPRYFKSFNIVVRERKCMYNGEF